MGEPSHKQKVVIINASNELDKILAKKGINGDEYIEKYVQPALQIQLDRDFTPAWGITAELIPHVKRTQAGSCDTEMLGKCPQAAEAWWLVLLDGPGPYAVTGYHDVLSGKMPTKRPIAKVFVKNDFDHGRDWTIAASHELLEMLVDPGMNLTVFKPEEQDREIVGRVYAYEICDPCDGEQYPITVEGEDIRVSNFVYPAWFEWFRNNDSTKFDHLRQASKPFQLTKGGFLYVLETERNLVQTLENLVGAQDNPVEGQENLVGTLRNLVGTLHNPVEGQDNLVGTLYNLVGTLRNLVGTLRNLEWKLVEGSQGSDYRRELLEGSRKEMHGRMLASWWPKGRGGQTGG